MSISRTGSECGSAEVCKFPFMYGSFTYAVKKQFSRQRVHNGGIRWCCMVWFKRAMRRSQSFDMLWSILNMKPKRKLIGAFRAQRERIDGIHGIPCVARWAGSLTDFIFPKVINCLTLEWNTHRTGNVSGVFLKRCHSPSLKRSHHVYISSSSWTVRTQTLNTVWTSIFPKSSNLYLTSIVSFPFLTRPIDLLLPAYHLLFFDKVIGSSRPVIFWQCHPIFYIASCPFWQYRPNLYLTSCHFLAKIVRSSTAQTAPFWQSRDPLLH